MNASLKILERLRASKEPLAVYEFKLWGIADTAVSARLRELAREGKVIGEQAEGKAYKVWSIKQKDQQELPL